MTAAIADGNAAAQYTAARPESAMRRRAQGRAAMSTPMYAPPKLQARASTKIVKIPVVMRLKQCHSVTYSICRYFSAIRTAEAFDASNKDVPELTNMQRNLIFAVALEMGVASVPLLAFGFEANHAAPVSSPSPAPNESGTGRMVGQMDPTKFGSSLLLPRSSFDPPLQKFRNMRALNRPALHGRVFNFYR